MTLFVTSSVALGALSGLPPLRPSSETRAVAVPIVGASLVPKTVIVSVELTANWPSLTVYPKLSISVWPASSAFIAALSSFSV